ncbi:MAG: UvrD-helicase domain-containing protein [Candidatus Symbiothrix sp.]|jgi:DNA helicase-2/ATP-dependent DNA helicase PcrA|nr:UvrD-helicase domain-containing protein [Candidatus Symbiothrix sp.]
MDEFLQQLNESQREAVIYNEGPSLVIAGAGSGKTRVLTYKIAYLLKQGISPYTILALTFTNKAAREMKSRIAQIVDENIARRLWMGTFHAIFSRILRKEADKFGYRSDFTVYDAQDSKNLIKAIIKEKALDDKIYKPASIQARISKAKNALITPEKYAHDREMINSDNFLKRERTCEIYATYWNRCRTSGVMDFDDLLLHTYMLFNQNPEVIEHYRTQFRFILVDEYQDTNSVQHEIVRQLAAEHHRVCVVGDDAQSIYSFRGANIGNILNFRSTYPECKLFKLEQNYRSTQNIVNAANSLIEKNTEQIPKTVFSEKEAGEKIRIISAYSDYEEGYNVASRIAEMRMLHQYEYKDFAILYRTNAQSRIFEEALRKINIPYRIYGGLSFYQRKEIKDVIAYMRLITNPNDEEAFKRIINYPARGIGDTTLNKIISTAGLHDVSLWEIISKPLEYNLNINAGTAKKLDGFQILIRKFMEANVTQNAYEVGGEIIRESGLSAELYTDRTPEGLSRVQNVEELNNSLYEFVSSRLETDRQDVKLSDFLAEISLMTDQDTDKDENASRVTMMTIHSSKGLEFRNVFVVGLEENLFPSELSHNNPKEIEEERRLFYVAITRAEENAILTYAKNRFRNGESQSYRPSRFLKDIDKKYLQPSGDMGFETRDLRTSVSETMNRPRNTQMPVDKTPEPVLYTNPRKLSRVEAEANHTVSRQSIGNLSVGNSIRHERFGQGKIIELTGENENAKASVEFDSFGRKQLLLKFAKFEKIE